MWLVEALDEFDDGGLTGAALSDEGDVLTSLYVEIEVLEDLGLALGVSEADIHELDLTFELLGWGGIVFLVYVGDVLHHFEDFLDSTGALYDIAVAVRD